MLIKPAVLYPANPSPRAQDCQKQTSGAQYTQSELPCPTESYQLKTRVPQNLDSPSLATYRKVAGATGAAVGALAGHVVVLGAGAAAGAALGGALLPGAGWVAPMVGGVLGTGAAGYLQGKTMIGRRVGSIVGGLAGQAVSPALAAVGVPISERRAEITENFGLGRLVKNGGQFFHSSIPNISKEEAQSFVDALRPGDIVLTKHEGSTIFNLLSYLPSGEYDFNHAILYLGDGQAIEATTGKGVHQFELAPELTTKHHAAAVRPAIDDQKAQEVAEASKKMDGVPYDYLFRRSTTSLYCSQLVQQAYKEVAPEVTFNQSAFLTKAFVLPGDLRKTDGGQVVAEAGEHHTFLQSMASKFS